MTAGGEEFFGGGGDDALSTAGPFLHSHEVLKFQSAIFIPLMPKQKFIQEYSEIHTALYTGQNQL